MKSTAYKGFQIEDFEGVGFTVVYEGNQFFFRTVDRAKRFIDNL